MVWVGWVVGVFLLFFELLFFEMEMNFLLEGFCEFLVNMDVCEEFFVIFVGVFCCVFGINFLVLGLSFGLLFVVLDWYF